MGLWRICPGQRPAYPQASIRWQENAVNRIHGTFGLIALAAAGVALAQTPGQPMTPEQTAPPSQYPTETNPPSSTSQSDSQSAKDAKKAQMKDCMAQQQASNSGMSKKDMKKYCKSQVNSSPPQS
jgi:Spy/CpxP family protein refolding chaperone